MAARDDDGVRVRRQVGARDPRGDVLDDDFDGVGKTFPVRKLLAVVDDVNAEADFVRDAREMKADVAGADDVELGRGFDGLDVDVHLAAANQTGFLREVVVQLVVDELRLARRDRFARLPERVVLVTAAADRADNAAVAEDEHLGADTLRRRPDGGHDRDERSRFAALERVGHGGEDFLVHDAIIRRA